MKTVKMREDKKQIVTHFEASTIKKDSEKPTQTKTVTDLGMSPCSNYLLQWRKRWTGVEQELKAKRRPLMYQPIYVPTLSYGRDPQVEIVDTNGRNSVLKCPMCNKKKEFTGMKWN